MSEPNAPNALKRKRIKYVIGAVAIIAVAQLLYSIDWSDRFKTEVIRSSDEGLQIQPPKNEEDRACLLLDRPFTTVSQRDFTKSGLRMWTQCKPVSSVAGWTVEHCVTPEREETVDEPPSCHPGGYFRIKRLNAPTNVNNLQSGTCQLNPTSTLSDNVDINSYATKFLGPDTFRIILVGPERISLLQQQSLGGCTYAIPYLISRPGRFWVQKILHAYQLYDSFNETGNDQWTPTYLGNDLIEAETRQQGTFYHFDVCPHCVRWTALDEAMGLGGTNDICTRDPLRQSRQYGTYSTLTPIKSVLQAVSHPYKWIPARPRCIFYPEQTSFEPILMEDDEKTKDKKTKAAQCLQKERSIYFVGDSHIKFLYSGLMQRLQGREGSIDTTFNLPTHVSKAGNIKLSYQIDDTMDQTLARINFLLKNEQDKKANIPDIGILSTVDTVILGFGSFTGHWTTTQFQERFTEVINGLVEIWKARQVKSNGNKLDRMNSLKIIWMGIPAWTDDPGNTTVENWKTNHRILYWNKMANGAIDILNTQIGGEGLVDRLLAFEITIPFRNSTQDHVHYMMDTVASGLSAELIHKLDLCS
ncbi:hypothetical protein BGZ76_000178 [Entomortierella beljakovae]|nr:hypothetical protein BGZ76_000178 [Entomortierella beljakovae]